MRNSTSANDVKNQWAKEGDRNTRFFHAKALKRRKNNTITGLQDSAGMWKDKVEEVEGIILEYFGALFQTSSPDPTIIDEILEAVVPRITPEMNLRLTAPFSSVEVNHALSQLSPLKSPGPDGLPAVFFHKFWQILGSDVFSRVLNFLNNRHLPRLLHYTFVVLIPKISSPTRITEFRPISLCNVVYKIGSKMIANRLKPFLDTIISPTQSAFVPRRLITDNVLVAFEVNHYLKCRTRGKTQYMALKLDVSKAYDRIEWIFLRRMLLKLGFADTFVELIMLCVSSISYSFLLNGKQFGALQPARGLRQGDPLFPYLFICCVEGFIRLIEMAVNQGHLHGIKIAPGAPMISNLCFADDTVLYCEASMEEATELLRIMDIYAQASGQIINLEKSSMLFSPGTPSSVRISIHNVLGIPVVDKFEKYLGMPAVIGRSKREVFAFIKDRIWDRVRKWNDREFSMAGREVLLKRLPWAVLCQPKGSGGMGLRDLECFNLAMLAKQAWRLVTNPQSLLARLLKARYFPRANYFTAEVGERPSMTWRSIVQARECLIPGLRRRIGNGTATSIWGDQWLPGPASGRIITRRSVHASFPDTVTDLIDWSSWCWNYELISHTFWPVDVQSILQVPFGAPDTEDRWA